MKILLVEDEVGQFETFVDILEELNFDEDISLSWTETSGQALKKIESEIYDIAFIDINLRGSLINGIELCRRIRTQSNNDFPIVIYTISRNAKDHQTALQAGASHFLIKPFRYKLFVQEIESLITQIKKNNKVPKP